MKVGLITDLACQFGDIVDDYFPDIAPRIYSYKIGSTKREYEPFAAFADACGVQIDEIAFVGEGFKSDYQTPRDLGAQAFWYVPDADTAPSSATEHFSDDVVTDLTQVFKKLTDRGCRLGF